MGPEKAAAAYADVKDVIEKGKMVAYTDNYDSKGYDRVVIAAPIEIAGKAYYMGVMLNRYRNSQRFYLHEVWLQDGSTKNKQGAHHTMVLDESSLNHGSTTAYVNSILDEIVNYKGKNENFSVKADADQSQRNREDAENLIQDAELYAQVMSDEDVRAAVQAFANVMDAVNKMTGDSAVRGAWQERLDEYASQIITETGSEFNKRN